MLAALKANALKAVLVSGAKGLDFIDPEFLSEEQRDVLPGIFRVLKTF